MKLTERIVAERITGLDQLTAAEQAIVRADPALQRLIEENRALATLGPLTPAPKREAMLATTYRAAAETKEHSMSLLARTFAGKKWYAQLALASALILAFAVIVIIVPHDQSWAKTDGYVLVYDIGTADCDETDATLKNLQFKMQEAITRFKDEHLTAEDGAEQEIQVAIWVKVENENATMAIALTENDPELLAALRDELATIPELPEPTEQPSTWYFDGKGPCSLDGGVNISLPDHSFYFPPGTSEEEMEKQIQQWLQEQHPGLEGSVEVNITEEDGKKRIEVRVEMPEGAEK